MGLKRGLCTLQKLKKIAFSLSYILIALFLAYSVILYFYGNVASAVPDKIITINHIDKTRYHHRHAGYTYALSYNKVESYFFYSVDGNDMLDRFVDKMADTTFTIKLRVKQNPTNNSLLAIYDGENLIKAGDTLSVKNVPVLLICLSIAGVFFLLREAILSEWFWKRGFKGNPEGDNIIKAHKKKL